MVTTPFVAVQVQDVHFQVVLRRGKGVMNSDAQRHQGASQLPLPDELRVRVRTLGVFRLERWAHSRWETVTESVWGRAYVRAVLACLVSSPSRRLGREQLIDALWPDLDLVVASSRLDRVLYDLRELLEPERDQLRVSTLLPSEREWVMLAPQSQVWVDVDAFEHLLGLASDVSGVEAEGYLLEALQLYDGPFLQEEREYMWTQGRRTSLEHSVVSALLQLADLRIARQSLLSALEVLDKLLALDPTNEAAVRRQMEVLLRLDRRSECLVAYKRLADALDRAFQVAPLPVLRTLYENICSGSFPGKQERGEVYAHYVCSPPVSETRGISSPLVGRERERALLQHTLVRTEHRLTADLHAPDERTADNGPQAVILLGQAGMGKTRLVQEIRDEAGARGWCIASYRVYDVEPSIPYRLWTEVLRSLLSHVESQEVQKRPLLFASLSVLVPELQERFPEITQAKETWSHQLQLWDAVYETLRLISSRVPLMICVDDLHSCDTDSLQLLNQVTYRLRAAPVFFVMTSREPTRDVLPSLLRTDTCATLYLSPLSEPDIARLVSSLDSTLSQKRIRCIERCANGNPSIASHYAQVSEAVTLVKTPVFPDVSAAWWHHVSFLPDAIEATFERQLAVLSRECQNLLRRASVFGCTFSAQHLVSLGGTAYDADTYIAYMEEALSAGILVERGARVSVEYTLWHPLLCSFLYRTLSAGRRAFQHRTIADGLRQDIDAAHGTAGSVAVLLYHLAEAGSDAQLVEFYSRYATQYRRNDSLARSAPAGVGVLSPYKHTGERVPDVLLLMAPSQHHGRASIRGSP